VLLEEQHFNVPTSKSQLKAVKHVLFTMLWKSHLTLKWLISFRSFFKRVHTSRDVWESQKWNTTWIHYLHGAGSLSWRVDNLTLGQEIPQLFGTPRLITMLRRVRHWALSWTSWIQSILSRPIP